MPDATSSLYPASPLFTIQRALEERLSTLCGDETAEEITESIDSDQLLSLVEMIVKRTSSPLLLSLLSSSASEELSRLLSPLL